MSSTVLFRMLETAVLQPFSLKVISSRSIHILFLNQQCDDSLIEVFAMMELRFIVFLHITNRAVYIESTRLYMSDKGRRESEPREKRKELMHNINDSDERAHTLRC